MVIFICLIICFIPNVICECIVKNHDTGKEEKCVFPFTFTYKDSTTNQDVNKTFTSCTTFYDKDGKYWCSTKVRNNYTCTISFGKSYFLISDK